MALVTALLVVAVAVAALAPRAAQQGVGVARAERLRDIAAVRHAALGIERWAAEVLRRDLGDGDLDHGGEAWARVVPAIAIDRVAASGALRDEQGRFNLNNLLREDGYPDPLWVARAQRLVELLGLAPELVPALLDWMDADQRPRLPGGAERLDYLRLDPPRLAANRRLVSLAELHEVQGFDAATVARLAPFVTVLPLVTDINVNTATAEVLQALAADTDAGAARAFVLRRQRQPVRDLDELRDEALFSGERAELDGLGVSSAWFALHAELRIGDMAIAHEALLGRGGDRVRTWWRRSGGAP